MTLMRRTPATSFLYALIVYALFVLVPISLKMALIMSCSWQPTRLESWCAITYVPASFHQGDWHCDQNRTTSSLLERIFQSIATEPMQLRRHAVAMHGQSNKAEQIHWVKDTNLSEQMRNIATSLDLYGIELENFIEQMCWAMDQLIDETRAFRDLLLDLLSNATQLAEYPSNIHDNDNDHSTDNIQTMNLNRQTPNTWLSLPLLPFRDPITFSNPWKPLPQQTAWSFRTQMLYHHNRLTARSRTILRDIHSDLRGIRIRHQDANNASLSIPPSSAASLVGSSLSKVGATALGNMDTLALLQAISHHQMEFEARMKLFLFGIKPEELALVDRCVALLDRIRGRVSSAQDALVDVEHEFAALGRLLDALDRHFFEDGSTSPDTAIDPSTNGEDQHVVGRGLIVGGIPLQRIMCDVENGLSLLGGAEGEPTWRARWRRSMWS